MPNEGVCVSVSIPERDFSGYQQAIASWPPEFQKVSIPERDFSGYQLNWAGPISEQLQFQSLKGILVDINNLKSSSPTGGNKVFQSLKGILVDINLIFSSD